MLRSWIIGGLGIFCEIGVWGLGCGTDVREDRNELMENTVKERVETNGVLIVSVWGCFVPC
jgi:hypothetical protein